MKLFETHLINQENQGLTVEQYLRNVLQYSGRRIQKLTRLKGILLNKKTVFLQKKIKAGDELKILLLEDRTYGVVPEQGPLEVLYEDSEVVVLNKPASILVHPGGQTTHNTLANYLAYYFQQKNQVLTIRPLHRLDRDTTGCVVFAKSPKVQTILEQQLQSGLFKRIYYALVLGRLEPDEGKIDFPIGKHKRKPNRRAAMEQGERAVTYYRTQKRAMLPDNSSEISLLELKLETGRTHQIRVHLAERGCPVLGDKMYGKKSALISRQALHARTVVFNHPTEERPLVVHAPWPQDFQQLIELK